MTTLQAPAWTRIKKEDLEKLTAREAELYRIRLEKDPPLSIRLCAERMGVSGPTVVNTWTRVKKRLGYDPLEGIRQKQGYPSSTRRTALDDMAEAAPRSTAAILEQKARIMLDAITKERAESASVGELSKGAEALIRARNLILGEPTQILRVEERKHIHDLIPAMLKEAERRGWQLRDGKLTRVEQTREPLTIEAESTRV